MSNNRRNLLKLVITPILRKWKTTVGLTTLVLAAWLYRRRQQRLLIQFEASPNQAVFSKPNPTPILECVYDYIIVGAGSSGCVIAARLSEDPNVKVLLLEAGGDDLDNPEIAIPAAAPRVLKTDADWLFSCDVEPNTNHRVHYWPRGKVLGGCSSVNWMLYVRGNKEDFDYWSRNGGQGWSYEEVLPYFKKSEDRRIGLTGQSLKKADHYHGVGGPLAVSDCRYFNPITDLFVEAALQAGIPKNEDVNGAEQLGVGKAQYTINNGERANTFAAFVRPILHRKNLTVITRALASRVIFHGTRATGVAFINGWGKFSPVTTKEIEVHARREVIVSGGTVNSAQLLLLSGVGPKEHLAEHRIPLVKDLPVGLNMQDHIMVPVTMELTKPVSVNEKDVNTLWNFLQYIVLKKGVFSSQQLESMAFVKTRPDLKWPDLQLHFSNGAAAASIAQVFDLKIIKNLEYGLTALPTLLHPKSKGFVKLRSRNPADTPIIRTNYLADDEDKRVLIEGVKLARKIFESPAFDQIRGSICEDDTIDHPAGSDEYILEYIKRYLFTVFHPVGTCRMGSPNDSNTVVDSELRVHGLQRIRVADASIMPEVISGNTNAPAIMIGEKVSDMIKEAWKNGTPSEPLKAKI